MNYIFVWQKTGEVRVPRFGEWYLTETLGATGPFQCNGKHIIRDKFEIVVRRPVNSRKAYKENAIVDKEISLQ